MSNMMLCHSALAKNPYFVATFGVNIYSIEELCYLLVKNAYLVDEDLMDEKLCDFLENEAGMPELGARLKEMLIRRCSVGEFVTEIIIEGDYCTEEELSEVRQTLVDNSGMDRSRKHKIRGDNMLKAKRYTHALDEYRYILENMEKDSDEILYSEIMHNMGTAYARLFFFERAAECFYKAYETGNKRVSLIHYLTAMKIIMDKEQYDRLILRYGYEDDVVEEVEGIIKKFKVPDITNEGTKQLDTLKEASESGKVSDFYRLMDETLDSWKRDYRRSMITNMLDLHD
ncbi:MAG: hypothetical protein K6B28_07940 [Lachnospiraceae bacterium]|nr:hypothetical protein [Lachnospiraceae bacterium]